VPVLGRGRSRNWRAGPARTGAIRRDHAVSEAPHGELRRNPLIRPRACGHGWWGTPWFSATRPMKASWSSAPKVENGDNCSQVTSAQVAGSLPHPKPTNVAQGKKDLPDPNHTRASANTARGVFFGHRACSSASLAKPNELRPEPCRLLCVFIDMFKGVQTIKRGPPRPGGPVRRWSPNLASPRKNPHQGPRHGRRAYGRAKSSQVLD